jgi:peptidoglycan/LPS O-acetylase OafA/YrhL
MEQTDRADRQRKFLPSLEGVRGYAFLVVFLAHCCWAIGNLPSLWWLFPVRFLTGVSCISVPVFFVLSGYLICGILIDTREREGYFKIFYSRRILRVFPLYYLTLAAVALICVLKGYSLTAGFWSHFLYIQNLLPNYPAMSKSVPTAMISHLWSMGVEEQFYLLWPLVVWFCPSRRILLRVTLALIACSFALRFAAPWLNVEPFAMNFWSPTRVDAILLGAVLVMIRDGKLYRWLEPIAQYVVLCGLGVIALTNLVSELWPFSTPLLAAIMISFWNIIAAAVVVAVMQEGSFLCRLCSTKRICWLGARSYGLYLFHYIFLYWLFFSLAPRIARFMPFRCAQLVACGCAFGLTVSLASLCYRFIEEPAMNLKKRLKYGVVKMPPAVQQPADSTLANVG